MTLSITCECAKSVLPENEFLELGETCPSCGGEVHADEMTFIREAPRDAIPEREVSTSQHTPRTTETRERVYRLLGLAYLMACVWFFVAHYVLGGPS